MTGFPFDGEPAGFMSGDWIRFAWVGSGFAFLVEAAVKTTQHYVLDVTHDFEAFFVTAARTPPPLSFAVPFFLPFFVGICSPVVAF